jgi:hypothetical protein
MPWEILRDTKGAERNVSLSAYVWRMRAVKWRMATVDSRLMIPYRKGTPMLGDIVETG